MLWLCSNQLAELPEHVFAGLTNLQELYLNNNKLETIPVLINSIPIAKIIAAGYFAGLVLTPLLLPYIPTQNFSFKGLIIGVVISALLFLTHSLGGNLLVKLAAIFFISGFSSFLAMNFTGASTFTSLAGVKKEMKIAVPIQIVSVVIAAILIVLNSTLSGR